MRDTGVLEDRSGRVCIKDSETFKIDNFVSGTIIAFLGTAQDGGYFQVEDYQLAGLPFNPQVPKIKLDLKRDLYDYTAMQKVQNRKFIAIVSGLRFGLWPDARERAELFAQFIKGQIGGNI